jgi:hypothetical protein
MASDSLTEDISQALRIVWLILGAVCGLVVLAPLLLPADLLLGSFPVCGAKAAGGQCFLCGMTTAFVRIGAGDVSGAMAANSGSIILYSALGLNFAAVLAYTMFRVIRHAIP